MVNYMKNYLKNYIKETEKLLNNKITKKDIENHLIKINFFSHERLVHLIVTMFFALFSIIFVYFSLTFNSVIYIVLTFIFLIILVFYILHYYFLENSVQYLYKLYDEMVKKVK